MGKRRATYNVITVGEVETGDIHACIEHLNQHVNIPAGGSESTNDLSLAHGKVDLLENVLELDAGGIRACWLGGFYHLVLLFVQSCLSKVFAFVLLKVQNNGLLKSSSKLCN